MENYKILFLTLLLFNLSASALDLVHQILEEAGLAASPPGGEEQLGPRYRLPDRNQKRICYLCGKEEINTIILNGLCNNCLVESKNHIKKKGK